MPSPTVSSAPVCTPASVVVAIALGLGLAVLVAVLVGRPVRVAAARRSDVRIASVGIAAAVRIAGVDQRAVVLEPELVVVAVLVVQQHQLLLEKKKKRDVLLPVGSDANRALTYEGSRRSDGVGGGTRTPTPFRALAPQESLPVVVLPVWFVQVRSGARSMP